MKTSSSFLFGAALAMAGALVPPAAAQVEGASDAAEADRDMRESRAALTAGLDRIVERSTLEYGEIRMSREIAVLGEESGPNASCTVAVMVRTPQFDGMTMEATASTCEKASAMVVEGAEALVE
ncbi:hypothetical protein HFP89_10620 [Wenzhouxiangella sp. XN79A]|uniref:hypothetical protein n=1 Tax=Wenzhouxiangella sp. XN79A TaxID=2724193 RepID=UPI00144A7839|nr:hypothetical protein [Wenzhouxiangella sp. XN79A]NKI35617.1 hypothetical protein [Wenzhouxiangella sp. XN79A]